MALGPSPSPAVTSLLRRAISLDSRSDSGTHSNNTMIYIDLIILGKNIPSQGGNINGQLEEEKERWKGREKEKDEETGRKKPKSHVVANLK